MGHPWMRRALAVRVRDAPARPPSRGRAPHSSSPEPLNTNILGDKVIPAMWPVRKGVLVVSLLVAAMGAIALARGVMGDTTYIDGDLVITQDTTLASGTWEVNGSINVLNVTLTLDNATLILNQSYDGDPDLWVTGPSGLILATDSAIHGHGYSMHLLLESEGRFANCTIGRERGLTGGSLEAEGRLVMSNCTVDSYNFMVRALDNVTVRDCLFLNATDRALSWGDMYQNAERARHIIIEGTRFLGGEGGSMAIALYGDRLASSEVRAIIRDCDVTGNSWGLYAMDFHQFCTLSMEDNDFEVSSNCVCLSGWGNVSLRGNVFNTTYGSECVAIYLGASYGLQLTNETYVGGNRCLRLAGHWKTVTADNVSVAGRVVGIILDRVWLEIRNSTFEGVDWDIAFDDDASIDIYDCESGHRVRFRTSSGRYCKSARVTEHRTIRPEAVVWQNGEGLNAGRVVVLNETGEPLGAMDMGAPTPVEVLIWNATWNTSKCSRTARMVLDDAGVLFASGPFDLWNTSAPLARFTDLLVPTIDVQWPHVGTVLPGHRIGASGCWTERGSGLRRIMASIDGGDWRDANASTDGSWAIELLALSDGSHVLRFAVEDRAGNCASTVRGPVLTDSVPPVIEILAPGRYVNTVSARLMGWTEPGSLLRVDGADVDVGLDGFFLTGILLEEGPNQVVVEAVDRAGNRNSTELLVELDLRPPGIFVDAPLDGSWSTSGTVEVSGWTEEDASVWVDGHVAERDRTTFRASVRGVDGLLVITIQAQDRASNTAEVTLSVWIDTCAPDLVVHSPEDGSMTSSPFLLLRGMVNDAGSAMVRSGGNQTAIMAVGAWALGVELSEGWNELDVVAIDGAGNRATQHLRVLLDTKSPIAYATLYIGGAAVDPRDGPFRTRERAATLAIEVYESCMAMVTDIGEVELQAGLRRISLVLVEGHNEPGVVVTDMAGNVGLSVTFPVVSDSTPPMLRVLAPRPGDVVVEGLLAVVGETEPGALVTVGLEPTVADATGGFSVEVVLTEGLNTINVSATDELGNPARAQVWVVQEVPYEVEGDDEPWMRDIVGPAVALAVVALLLLSRSRWMPASRGRAR